MVNKPRSLLYMKRMFCVCDSVKGKSELSTSKVKSMNPFDPEAPYDIQTDSTYHQDPSTFHV